MTAIREVTDQAALTLGVDGDGVAWIVFDRPGSKVNLLTAEALATLDALLGEVEESARAGRVRALIIRSGKDGSFIAGADVGEIGAVATEEDGYRAAREGQRIFQRVAAMPVPTVAAVDGLCLGGGTELILACRSRIASDRPETKIGLPEIRLGILPGFGGTTRLPRLVGLTAALPMILTGSTARASKARRIGLVDETVHPAILYRRAAALALEGKRGAGAKRTLVAKVLDGPGAAVALRQARKQVMRETRGRYPAPLAALDVIAESRGKSLERALDMEAHALGRLIVTDVSKNLVRVFGLMEGAKKAGPRDVEPRAVRKAAVLGAGVMGGGIAQLLAQRGCTVRLKDIDAGAIGRGLLHARQLFDRSVKKKRLGKLDATRGMNAISGTLEYTGFRGVDIAIEAVVERLDVKRTVLREVEARLDPDAVLVSNTSSLSITAMQEALERPADFCGMHFFNPVHRMPLIEVVRGRHTGDRAIASVVALARRLDKTPVIVNDGPGFLVNRILAPYLNEAGWLLGEGGAIDAIDRILLDFGMPMGPLRLLDEVGFDIARHAGATMQEAFGERMRSPPALDALPATGLLGRKGGLGFYRYEKDREAGVNEEIYAKLAPSVPASRTTIDHAAVRDRTVLSMVNEAARLLDDGIAAGPGDVDLAMITGTGFPPFRGGLLRWADSLGIDVVLARLEGLAGSTGSRFEPAPLIRRLASEARGFYD